MVKVLLSCLLAGLWLHLFAQPAPDPHFELYILMGQSNMAGRGPLTDSFKQAGNEQLLVFNKERAWVTAHHPLHFDKPAIVAVGPGLSFGLNMLKHSPGSRVGLIPCAVGGTPIEHWLPGAYDSATNTHPWDDAAERITAAMQTGVIKGVIWHQGEANSAPGKSQQYLLQLQELISRVRNLVGNPQLPFVAGELGYFFEHHEGINQQLELLPKLVPVTAVAQAGGLTDKGDHVHFDAQSADELGKRYAVKMMALLKK